MRILHVVSGYFPETTGGTQTQLRDLCSRQMRRGHRVHIFTRAADPERDELEESRGCWEGVPVTRVNNTFKNCSRFELLYSDPAIDARFRDCLTRLRPHIVHIHHLTCLSTSLIEDAKSLGIPVVAWISDYWMACPRGQRFHPLHQEICQSMEASRCLPCLHSLWPHFLPLSDSADRQASAAKLAARAAHMRRMLDLCDATLAPSVFHRRRFVEWGVDPKRCHVVTYGLPREQLLAPPRGRRPIRRIGFTGTVIPSKGVHVLIEAFNRLNRPELTLEIHGEQLPYHEKTDYLDELRAAVRPGLRVRFGGRYEIGDLPTLLERIDLLAIPSLWWESYCITAREGALAGLPVIVFGLGGLAEAVDAGMALGCSPDDPDALAAAMARVCDDADLRDGLSRKAGLVRHIGDCEAQIDRLYHHVLGETLA